MPGHSRSKNGVASLAYVPGIHVLQRASRKTWMAGTSPAMTSGPQRRQPVGEHQPVASRDPALERDPVPPAPDLGPQGLAGKHRAHEAGVDAGELLGPVSDVTHDRMAGDPEGRGAVQDRPLETN